MSVACCRIRRASGVVTASCLTHNRFRNFYVPGRSDMFVGFRTCTLD
jgi:hypothetical protein